MMARFCPGGAAGAAAAAVRRPTAVRDLGERRNAPRHLTALARPHPPIPSCHARPIPRRLSNAIAHSLSRRFYVSNHFISVMKSLYFLFCLRAFLSVTPFPFLCRSPVTAMDVRKGASPGASPLPPRRRPPIGRPLEPPVPGVWFPCPVVL